MQAESHDAVEYEHPLSSRVSSLEPLSHSQSLKRQMAEAANRKEVSLEHHAMAPQLPVACFAIMSWDVPCSSVHQHLLTPADGCLGFTGSARWLPKPLLFTHFWPCSLCSSSGALAGGPLQRWQHQ